MRHKLQQWSLILALISILCFGLITANEAKSEPSQSNQRHVLERLSFGVDSAQMKQVETKGIEAYIQSQLNPQLVRSPKLDRYLAEIISINKDPLEAHKKQFLRNKMLKDATLSSKEQEKIKTTNVKLRTQARQEAMDARLVRSIYSSNQLEEVMVDFWLNHFNIFAGKGPVTFWTNDYENKIRANALGSFRDLLQVTASHPAMLIYLDNNQSRVVVNSKTKKTVRRINENYARELMELHTLGVDAGYTQEDIIALARIFTGWGLDLQDKPGSKNGFFFDKKRHDRGKKTFLGQKITEKGMAEGEQALDILANHPATARHISYKLAQYFVADRPPSSLVDKLAQKFTESNGNIKVVLDTLIHSQEFNDPQYYGKKFKTPYQYIVSLIRMGEIEQAEIKRVRGMLYHLSMPVYMCNPPTGYKNTEEAWLNSQSMLQRIGFASAIARGVLNKEDPINYQQLSNNMVGLSDRTKEVILKNPPKLRSALIMGSPEAMYR